MVSCDTHRIECPAHGVLTADVPWAYPGSGFTKDFDLTVGWLAVYLPRSTISEYMRIDWETVGKCVHRTLRITECVNEFTPDCERCVEPFHVVEWAMEALGEVCREVWREAYSEAVQLAKAHPGRKGRPREDDAEAAIVRAARARADEIKVSYSMDCF